MAKNQSVNKTSDVIDFDLSAIRKKRFRIDGDDNRILELNTSDLNILSRLKESYPKLENLAQQATEKLSTQLDDDTDDDTEYENPFDDPKLANVVDVLTAIDSDMRTIIDYIFDAPVSDLCAPNGNMYDPVNGQFRYEHIIVALTNLYESELSTEMNKVSNRIKKHTDKYTKKR